VTDLPLPVFQRQGPASRCKIDGKELGWKTCTAYSMAMGIDAHTGGTQRPSGCKIRMLTGDTEAGLTLRQVADAAQARYGIRVAVKTGGATIAPNKAARLARAGRGFVLQGNAGALLGTPSQSTRGPVNHAIWVQAVRGGTDDVPDQALVYDPAADGRPLTASKRMAHGPQWWPWERLLAFAADLRMNDAGTRRLGPGRFYAGFIPPRPASPVVASPVVASPGAPAPAGEPTVRLAPGASLTSPSPLRLRAAPPSGDHVNVRNRTDTLSPDTVVGQLFKGDLFIAFQRVSGLTPPGATSPTWFGNADGTQWVHISGVDREAGQAVPAPGEPTVQLAPGASMTTPFPLRLRADPPSGRRVNVRSRTDTLSPATIVDRLSKRDLFIAYQRVSGLTPPGATSPTWFGNPDGTEWVHISGVNREGGAAGHQQGLVAESPVDVDVDDDIVPGSEDLPDEIHDDDLAPEEPPEAAVAAPDTDLDAPVEGEPVEGEIPEA
jgi:hypothetical protein